MELSVKNNKGQETGSKVNLADAVFGIEPNQHAIYLDVKQYLANQRQGTHKAKERSEIAGSTKKIKRQKGTGTARAGSMKSPIFRGGGRVFGPRPRNYSFKLNRKLKALARKSALSAKAQSQDIIVMDQFGIDTPKTKEFISIMNGLAVSDDKTLFVTPDVDKNAFLSSRNIPNAKVVGVNELNTYELVNAEKIVILESAVDSINNSLS